MRTKFGTVKDTRGDILLRTSIGLREFHKGQANDWATKYSAIRAAAKAQIISGGYRIGINCYRMFDNLGVDLNFIPATSKIYGKIGCRSFDLYNWHKIMKAAGVTREMKTKAKTKAKALAAKAGA
jgi:hypothetical protein